MRTDFSPTSAAARLLATRPSRPRPEPASATPNGARWCEWPRRPAAPATRGGIWQTLQAIQARHA